MNKLISQIHKIKSENLWNNWKICSNIVILLWWSKYMSDVIFEKQTKITEHESILKEYYARYLTDIRGLSFSSVKHYFDALNNISRKKKKKGLVQKDIYEIGDLEQLERVREILYADSDFMELNERGKRMYSAGLNNYYRFASGEGFQQAKDKICLLDVPMYPEDIRTVEQNLWKRSRIVRTQVIEFAGYSCEINAGHESFVAEKNKKPYMESHHAIPMRLQPQFHNSLDVYANIVCLCPLCHRRIHYGLKEEKRQMMNYIYTVREERLLRSGIKLSKQEFADLVTPM